jgi:hypothetical protein
LPRTVAALLVAAAVARAVEQLDILATWCTKNKLFLDRNLAYELVLRFDPDHREARKWLKYVQREGQWVRLGTYTPPKNMNAKAEPAYAERRAEIVKQFAGDVIAALEKEGAGWTEAERRLAVEDVLAVDPDNEKAHALNGQVRVDGRWVLAGTARAASRRHELVQAARAALAAVPEPRAVAIGQDAQLGVAWTDAVETETWRVVATTGTEEARRAAVIATATIPLFEAAFGITVEPRSGQVYYVMKQQPDFQQVLTNHPRCTPEFRKFAFGVSSAWLPRTAVLLAYSPEAATRLEYAARQPFAALLLRGFGITARQGWAYEGIGLYLTELLTGTHTTYTIHPTGYAPDHQREKTELWNRIRAPESDWFDVARQLAGEGKAPDLVDMMSKDVNTMDAEDLIFSYALAGYLLEARADVAPDLLRAVGEKKIPFHDAVPKILGLDVRALQKRFEAWLGERR